MDIPSHLEIFWHHLRTGKAHAARGEYDRAISAFTLAIDAADREVRWDREARCPKTGSKPPYPFKAYCEAHFERGRSLAQKGNHTDAIRDFAAVIEQAKNPSVAVSIDKFLIESYLQRGILYARQADAGPAIADFTAVIQLTRRHSEALFRRALSYLESGEPQRAQADFERAQAIDPFGFMQLQGAFMSLAVPKASATLPDIQFGKTIGDTRVCLER